MNLSIDANARYDIGRIPVEDQDNPSGAQFSGNPTTLSGADLINMGINNWNDFFAAAPMVGRIRPNTTYYVYLTSSGDKKYITHGTVLAYRQNTGTKPDLADQIAIRPESSHNIRFFKEQLQEKDRVIQELTAKNDSLLQQLLQEKEARIVAENQIKQNIALNDERVRLEEQILQTVREEQAKSEENSNAILSQLLGLANQVLPSLLNRGSAAAPAPAAPPASNLADGTVLNRNGQPWQVQTMNGRKVIVNQSGDMELL